MPINDKEADAILQRVQEGVEKPRPKVLFEPGEMVRVTDGPFNDFNGVVEEVNYEKSRLRVAVLIFGRSTPVELEFGQVEKATEGCQPASERSATDGVNRGAARRFAPAGGKTMAKKVAGYIKLQVKAGQANPSPPVGPALGQRGLNIMEFCKAFNAQTQKLEPGLPIPVDHHRVFSDRSFTFIMKTPPASVLIKKAVGIEKGSGARTPRRSARSRASSSRTSPRSRCPT